MTTYAEDALTRLKRALRDLKLAERASATGAGFELRGKRIAELQAGGDDTVQARLARRPMQTPEWDRFAIAASPDERKLLDELKKRLARWEREE